MIRREQYKTLTAALLAAAAMGLTAIHVSAQSAPATTAGSQSSSSPASSSTPGASRNSDKDYQNTLEEATQDSGQSQMTQSPNLNSLNENADSVRYTDRGHGPLYLSVDAMGAWTSNLLNSFSNQKIISGTYFNLGVPLGVQLSSPVTDFRAYFREDATFYPGYSSLNHTSEIYSQQLEHRISDTTTTSWALAGGRVIYLGHYLPPVIQVGSTGVALPAQSGGLQPMYDAATTYSVNHELSERDSVTVAATGGWLDQPASDGNSSATYANRQLTGGGVIHFQRALNDHQQAGIELTNVYIKGLSPAGDSNFTAAKLTFAQNLTPHTSFSAGLGPLFSHASSVATAGTSNNLNYSANASFDYQRPYARITAGYERIYQLGYLLPSSAAHAFFFLFDKPIARNLDVTLDSRYMRTSGSSEAASVADYSTFGATARIDTHITSTLGFYVGVSSFRQDSTGNGYRYSQVSSGITYFFGNPLSRTGLR